MDGIQMEPIGKYKADRNGSAKAAAWRNMVDQDLDDVAFLADSEKAREARELREAPVAVCSQRRALCLAVLVFSAIFASALLVVYATPQPECPCAGEVTLIPGQPPTDSEANTASSNKERLASNGAVFPWRGARLPTFVIPRHYSLWLHPNLTTGELRGEVSIDFRVDRDTSFLVINVRDMNVTERALFKSGGSLGPKVAKTLEYPQADQSYIEFKATFKIRVPRKKFHVSLTNMPIVATEEAGFYLGHRLLQDEFATSPPMSPHMMALAVCRLQRRAAPPVVMETNYTDPNSTEVATETPEEETPEISLYSDRQVILDESGPLLEWVQKTIQLFSYELNTSYPLPKFDIVVVEGGNPYSEGWGLITLAPSSLSDTKTIARLLAQQWFGGLVSPRWWGSQWLMEALTSLIAEKAPGLHGEAAKQQDALLLDHILPALRLDASSSVRAVASLRLERTDIETATDELSLHKGAAIVSMAIEAAGEEAGRAALARLLRHHRTASADARDLWRALQRDFEDGSSIAQAWDGWCEKAGYPLLLAETTGDNVLLRQERFVMTAPAPETDMSMMNLRLTLELRGDLDDQFNQPENFTEPIDESDLNYTTTPYTTSTTTRRPTSKPTKAPPPTKWVIPVTFTPGPLAEDNSSRAWNITEGSNATWYDVGNETRTLKQSKWPVNVTQLIWFNDTDMVIPDLGKHKWVRFNVGARGLYRVAIRAAMYDAGSPADRALLLDDIFTLSRAGRVQASSAMAAAARLSSEEHWAPWRVVLSHLSWWRELLHLGTSGPRVRQVLSELHTRPLTLYIKHQAPTPEELWLSGALLTAGVEWGNVRVTKQAVKLFELWYKKNESIPEIYQEAAFTAGVRNYGERAWQALWSSLMASYAAPRPLYSHKALLTALASPEDDWLFYRFAVTVMSQEAQRGREWKMWTTILCASACKWRGTSAIWRILYPQPVLPPSALQAAANCIHLPSDYHRFKHLFLDYKGGLAALDIIAQNAMWVGRADADLHRYFTSLDRIRSGNLD
ncbi:hypothetical protein K1T71_000661 [Dendrolimus kikuchii]|uniref:Uncharacterized protein n=1 Tax=Dendrolimus kikuchii TaxID=765133 RepID=A0ACC1DJV1_9NEOP|nr:hypothetical protein K1T71_000661 [Dendrolimus kikuchii]